MKIKVKFKLASSNYYRLPGNLEWICRQAMVSRTAEIGSTRKIISLIKKDNNVFCNKCTHKQCII